MSSDRVDNTVRRKWDRQEYLEKARKRAEDEQERRNKAKDPAVPKAPLKHRDFQVNLEAKLGKTQVITQLLPINQQAGYFCKECNCVVKDSANYLDHINGKKHQRALGMSMRVERSTLEQVQNRLQTGKRKPPEEEELAQEFHLRVLKQQEEDEEKKRRRKERKKEKKKEKMEEPEIDAEVAEAMGFGGFGMKK